MVCGVKVNVPLSLCDFLHSAVASVVASVVLTFTSTSIAIAARLGPESVRVRALCFHSSSSTKPLWFDSCEPVFS
jgi:hypothetical protein